MGVREVGGRASQVEKEVGRIIIIWGILSVIHFLMEFSPVEGELSFITCTVISVEIDA